MIRKQVGNDDHSGAGSHFISDLIYRLKFGRIYNLEFLYIMVYGI